MAKTLNQPILVIIEKNTPRRFFWLKRWIDITKITDIWKDVGRWWDDEEEKKFYRVLSSDGGMYEIYSDNKLWNLYKVYD